MKQSENLKQKLKSPFLMSSLLRYLILWILQIKRSELLMFLTLVRINLVGSKVLDEEVYETLVDNYKNAQARRIEL